MSGICAILRLDGAPPDGIGAMATRLERRGPEGTRLFQDGPCAMGHTLLATTPESQHESLPLMHPETGCTISADARIDNRDDLLAQFGLATAGHVIGDGALILRAWLQWGTDCPAHLRGDFAFVVWDPRRQSLFAARDPMGMKSVIWCHRPGRLFACATEAEAVLQARDVPRILNTGRVADVLETYLEAIDKTETFFQDVWRLPPAHWLLVSPQGIRKECYWQPAPGPLLQWRRDEDYVDAFRDVMDRAIARRLRAPDGRVGAMLSGGMDSGAVVALAAAQRHRCGAGPLPTFSAMGPDPATCPETAAVLQVTQMHHIAPTLVNWANLGPLLPRLVAALDQVDEPFDTHMNMIRALCLTAADKGARVLLTGVSGDLVLLAGAHARWLIRRARLIRTVREARGLAAFHGPHWRSRHFLTQAARQGFAPLCLRRLAFARRMRGAATPQGDLLTQAGADLVGLGERARRWAWHAAPARLPYQSDRALRLLHPSLTVGIERYDRVAGQLGVECRDPYLDREVIDFCLRLPPLQLQRDGWPKWIQRRAMDGYLPDSVRWKTGRDHVGWQFSDTVYQAALASSCADDGNGGGLSADRLGFDINSLLANPLPDRQDASDSRSLLAELRGLRRFLARTLQTQPKADS